MPKNLPVCHGGLGGSAKQPSIDTRTDITYTKPPTFRNTVLVLWLSLKTNNSDWKEKNVKTFTQTILKF